MWQKQGVEAQGREADLNQALQPQGDAQQYPRQEGHTPTPRVAPSLSRRAVGQKPTPPKMNAKSWQKNLELRVDMRTPELKLNLHLGEPGIMMFFATASQQKLKSRQATNKSLKEPKKQRSKVHNWCFLISRNKRRKSMVSWLKLPERATTGLHTLEKIKRLYHSKIERPHKMEASTWSLRPGD